MTATDGRMRSGGDPGPSDPPDETGGDPAAAPTARASDETGTPDATGTVDANGTAAATGTPDGPAIARVRARAPLTPPRPSPGPVPPGVARRVGRHARPESESTGHTPPPGYRPRHAAPGEAPDGSGAPSAPIELRPPAGPPTPAAPPDVEIDPTPVRGLPLASTFPASGVTASETVPSENKKPLYGWQPEPDAVAGAPVPARQRIVLAERRSPTRAVGTVAEIEQQTATGELLLSNLMRSQLMLAVRLVVVGVIVLGALPIVFLTMPGVAGTVVFGVSLPWVLLGVLAFPLLLLVGWFYTRTAERNELDFADDVED